MCVRACVCDYYSYHMLRLPVAINRHREAPLLPIIRNGECQRIYR